MVFDTKTGENLDYKPAPTFSTTAKVVSSQISSKKSSSSSSGSSGSTSPKVTVSTTEPTPEEAVATYNEKVSSGQTLTAGDVLRAYRASGQTSISGLRELASKSGIYNVTKDTGTISKSDRELYNFKDYYPATENYIEKVESGKALTAGEVLRAERETGKGTIVSLRDKTAVAMGVDPSQPYTSIMYANQRQNQLNQINTEQSIDTERYPQTLFGKSERYVSKQIQKTGIQLIPNVLGLAKEKYIKYYEEQEQKASSKRVSQGKATLKDIGIYTVGDTTDIGLKKVTIGETIGFTTTLTSSVAESYTKEFIKSPLKTIGLSALGFGLGYASSGVVASNIVAYGVTPVISTIALDKGYKSFKLTTGDINLSSAQKTSRIGSKVGIALQEATAFTIGASYGSNLKVSQKNKELLKSIEQQEVKVGEYIRGNVRDINTNKESEILDIVRDKSILNYKGKYYNIDTVGNLKAIGKKQTGQIITYIYDKETGKTNTIITDITSSLLNKKGIAKGEYTTTLLKQLSGGTADYYSGKILSSGKFQTKQSLSEIYKSDETLYSVTPESQIFSSRKVPYTQTKTLLFPTENNKIIYKGISLYKPVQTNKAIINNLQYTKSSFDTGSASELVILKPNSQGFIFNIQTLLKSKKGSLSLLSSEQNVNPVIKYNTVGESSLFNVNTFKNQAIFNALKSYPTKTIPIIYSGMITSNKSIQSIKIDSKIDNNFKYDINVKPSLRLEPIQQNETLVSSKTISSNRVLQSSRTISTPILSAITKNTLLVPSTPAISSIISPPIPSPPPIIPPLFLPSRDNDSKPSNKNKRKISSPKQKKKYTPSLTSVVYGIKSKRISNIDKYGLGLRPIKI